MRDIVQQHVETFDEDNMRDFVDVYLREMRNSPDVSFTGKHDFKAELSDHSEEQLLVNAMDLFSAGSETTATTLAWAVCFMILYPDVQKKVQKEIDAILGDRAPTLDDRGRFLMIDLYLQIDEMHLITGFVLLKRQ